LVACVLLHAVQEVEVVEDVQEQLPHDEDDHDDLVHDQVLGEPHTDGETFLVEQVRGREWR